MPTTITTSIGTDGRDRSTWQSWVDMDIPANLVTADEQHVGEAYNDSEFTITAIITVDGHTTDATRNIILTTGSGQSFRDHADKATNPLRYNASVGVGIRGTVSLFAALDILDPYTEVRGLQIKTASNNNVCVRNGGETGQIVDSCIFENLGSGVSMSGGPKILNCLTIQRRATFSDGYVLSGSGALAAGCTAVRPSGLTVGGIAYNCDTNTTVKNCAGFGFTDFADAACSGDYNASDDTTNLPGANSNGALTYADQFEDNGNTTPDFRAKSTGDLQMGTPDATNTPDDIIGTTRDATTPWVGAWEVPAAGGGLSIPIAMHHYKQLMGAN